MRCPTAGTNRSAVVHAYAPQPLMTSGVPIVGPSGMRSAVQASPASAWTGAGFRRADESRRTEHQSRIAPESAARAAANDAARYSEDDSTATATLGPQPSVVRTSGTPEHELILCRLQFARAAQDSTLHNVDSGIFVVDSLRQNHHEATRQRSILAVRRFCRQHHIRSVYDVCATISNSLCPQ